MWWCLYHFFLHLKLSVFKKKRKLVALFKKNKTFLVLARNCIFIALMGKLCIPLLAEAKTSVCLEVPIDVYIELILFHLIQHKQCTGSKAKYCLKKNPKHPNKQMFPSLPLSNKTFKEKMFWDRRSLYLGLSGVASLNSLCKCNNTLIFLWEWWKVSKKASSTLGFSFWVSLYRSYGFFWAIAWT